MSAIGRVSTGQAFYPIANHAEYSEKKFYRVFQQHVKSIGTDDIACSSDKSITSFDIAECITVFVIEKDSAGNIEQIMGFHIADYTTVEDLKSSDYFDKFIFGNNSNSEESDNPKSDVFEGSYKLLIVGGSALTTNPYCLFEGRNCLLDNIRQAIHEFFPEGSYTIDESLVNPNTGTNFTFVSANLQMDGTLSFCRHKNRHL
jgi:hypothetical protein